MVRILLIVVLAVTLTSSLAQAQQPVSMRRIGLLWIKGEASAPRLAGLRDGLRAHGYVEGRHFQFDERFLVEHYEGLPNAATRLAEEKPDVIVVSGATAMLSARKATTTIPIVMITGGDPVKLGAAASLARPGGNVTGMTSMVSDLSGKRLELLKELVPGMRRVAVVLYAESKSEILSLKNYEAAARSLNLEIRPVEVRGSEEIASVVAGTAKLNVNAIAFVGSTLLAANRTRVVTAVARSGLPAMYTVSDYVDDGGLISYGASGFNLARGAAAYIDKILKGAKPSDLPIEQTTKVELVINLRTAKTMGITIPRALLVRADRVIE